MPMTPFRFIVFIFICLSAYAANADTLVWVTDDTPGGNYIIGGGPEFQRKNPGIEIELYQLVAEILSLDVRLERRPWNLCLHLIEQNKVDGIFPASFKSSRTKIGTYPMKNGKVDTTRKTRNNGYFLYKLKKDPIHWDGHEFKNVSGLVGIPLGWSIAEDLKPKYHFIREETVNRKTPKLLIHKRLQGFVCLETVFDAYLEKYPNDYGNIEKVKPPIWEKPYYLMLSHKFTRNRPKLAEQIWDTIKAVKQTKRYSSIVKRYVD